jgi:hypothetical protein
MHLLRDRARSIARVGKLFVATRRRAEKSGWYTRQNEESPGELELQEHSIHEEMKMRPLRGVYAMIALMRSSLWGVAQELPGDESAPLVLVRIIPIPGVSGHFDHMAVDNNRGRVFAAVYGNDRQRGSCGYRAREA